MNSFISITILILIYTRLYIHGLRALKSLCHKDYTSRVCTRSLLLIGTLLNFLHFLLFVPMPCIPIRTPSSNVLPHSFSLMMEVLSLSSKVTVYHFISTDTSICLFIPKISFRRWMEVNCLERLYCVDKRSSTVLKGTPEMLFISTSTPNPNHMRCSHLHFLSL